MTQAERFCLLYEDERLQRLISARIRSFTRDPDRDEDIRSRIWERVWVKLCRDEQEIEPPWFWMTIWHCTIDAHRFANPGINVKHKVSFVPLREAISEEEESGDPEHIAIGHEQVHQIVHYANLLPSLQREAVLCTLRGEKSGECATRLGVPVREVRAARRYGIGHIRKDLGLPRGVRKAS